MSSLSTALRRPRNIIIMFVLLAASLVILFPLPRSSNAAETPNLNVENVELPVNHTSRPNGVIFMLLPPSRAQQAIIALKNVEQSFNRRLKYPYILFMAEGETKEVTDVQKKRIDHITEGRATFAEVSKSEWDPPESLDKSLIEASLKKIGFSLGYRAMCRWYSGFFWKHPAFKSYDWFWRLDTDIEFHCDVPYDPIQYVIDRNAVYGFVQASADADWVQPTLASNVSAFMTTETFPPDVNHAFVWRGQEGVEKALRGEAGNAEWNTHCMYNNFEISHRSVWENKIYQNFFDHLDRAGGFYYERWGDSPIHSYGVSMTLRKDQVAQFKDLGYQHQGWEYGCPAQSPSCTCVQEEEFKNFNDHGDWWFEA